MSKPKFYSLKEIINQIPSMSNVALNELEKEIKATRLARRIKLSLKKRRN